MKKALIRSALILASLVAGAGAEASNGYFSHGFGSASKAMAGAGTALPLDTMGTAINPALMPFVGNRLDLGVALFFPDRGFVADTPSATPMGVPFITPGEYESGVDIFAIPHLGYNRMLDSETSLGISIGGNGGMNTEYDAAVFGNFAPPGMTSSPTGIDLMQMFVGVTLAKKLSPYSSIGIAPILAVQSLETQGLEPFAGLSLHPEHVTNQGHDLSIGGGVRVGWYGEVNDRLSLGVSYQTRLYMTPFEDYEGLLAEEGDFDIPPIFNVGLAFKVNPSLTLLFDVQEIMFSKIRSLSNANNVLMMPGTVVMGNDGGMGFGWQDMTVYKMGVQWQADDKWTLRAGFSTADQVLPNSQALFNTLAPATVRKHATFGFTYQYDKHHAINFAAMHAFDEKVPGTNPNTPFQTGHLQMHQTEVELSWSWTF